MIERVFTKNIGIPFVGGLFLCGILAAIMSTADSQLLVCASSVSKDIYKSFIRKDADDKRIMKVTRITVIVVALIAIVIAWDPESSIMGLVSDGLVLDRLLDRRSCWHYFGNALICRERLSELLPVD